MFTTTLIRLLKATGLYFIQYYGKIITELYKGIYMRDLTEYQSVACLLHAVCDGCGEKREALLSTWVTLDDSGDVSTRLATTVLLLEDPLIRRVFAQNDSGIDIELLMHFDEFTDEERQIRFMDAYIKPLIELYNMGVYTAEEALVILQRRAKELAQDIQKESCGAYFFFDAESGRPFYSPHIIELCDEESMFALTV